MYLKLVYLLGFFAQLSEMKIAVDVHAYTDCPGFDSQDMDFSNLQFELDDDGFIIMDGNFTILKEVADPYPLYIHSEQLERGEWRDGMITRQVTNFCASLQSPSEIWFPVFKQLNRQSCPFPVGYVGKFDNFKVGKLPLIVTPNFLGEWKIYMEHRDAKIHPEPLGCAMQRLSIFEV